MTQIQYYGWSDLTPPSNHLANPVIHHNGAGGVGTYADPISASAYLPQFPAGTIFYIPDYQKYGIVEDGSECITTCDVYAGGGLFSLDLWVQSDASTPFAKPTDPFTHCVALLEVNSNAPISHNIIFGPAANLTVSSEPLFDQKTRHCFGHGTI